MNFCPSDLNRRWRPFIDKGVNSTVIHAFLSFSEISSKITHQHDFTQTGMYPASGLFPDPECLLLFLEVKQVNSRFSFLCFLSSPSFQSSPPHSSLTEMGTGRGVRGPGQRWVGTSSLWWPLTGVFSLLSFTERQKMHAFCSE